MVKSIVSPFFDSRCTRMDLKPMIKSLLLRLVGMSYQAYALQIKLAYLQPNWSL